MSLKSKLETNIYYNPITHGFISSLCASNAIIGFGSGENLSATFWSVATMTSVFTTGMCFLWDGNRSEDDVYQEPTQP